MSEAPTPPVAPKKKSLTEIFNHFASDATERFPQLKGQLLILDMNEHRAHGNKDIDTKKTGLTKETALDYLSEHPLTQQMEKDKRMSSLATRDPERNVNIIMINDSVDKSERGDVSKKTEQHLLFVLDHELAHCAIKNGFSNGARGDTYSVLMGESIADAYALIRHYQRFGTESAANNKYVSPGGRADNFMLWGDSGHFTSFVLDAITKRKDVIDFNKLDSQQTADLARRFALEYIPPKQVIDDLSWAFAPIKSEFKKNPSTGLKALIEKTLDPTSDYYTFKFGSLWLKAYMEDRTLADGKPINLPKEYLDDAAKKLKERELKFAKEDILFNMPIVPSKPPAYGFNAPKFAA